MALLSLETQFILKKLSFTRILNAIKVFLSYYYSKLLGKSHHWGMPITVSIEPTTACNLKCPECPSGLRSFTRPTGNLKSSFFKNYIDEVYHHLTALTFYFQGEPYIHPEFLDMVRYANDHNIYTMTSTNGHFLTPENCIKTVESGLDRLIISLDGTTQETYEQYRIEGKIEKVISGIKNIVEAKKKLKSKRPLVVIQFLVVKPNEHQIPEIQALTKSLGANQLVLKTAQIYDYTNGSNLIPEQSIYSRYQKETDGSYRVKNRFLNECWRMWQGCVITWDGRVVPCCFDKDAEHQLGKMPEQNFHSIWHGATYNKFRNQILSGRDQIEICKNCTEGGFL